MAFLLFTIYFIAGLYLISKSTFVKNAGFNGKTIFLLFAIKIFAGVMVGLINHYLFNNHTDNDTLNTLGMIEYQNLFHHPKIFFTDIFKSNYAEYGAYFGSKDSYWNDLKLNILLKVLGVMNIFSRGNIYINGLFFNTIAILAHVALYRVFQSIYPKKSIPIIIGCFILPSLLYYSSGIQKDLIVFTALGIFCYSLYFSLLTSFSAKKIFYLVSSFIIILLIRNFIAVILLPCSIAWIMSKKYQIKPLKIYASLAFIACLFVALLQLTSSKYNPLQIVADRQQAFINLGKANTDYKIDTLQPTLQSFMVAAPTALRRSFLSPLPGEFDYIYMNLLAVEIMAYLFFFILMVFFKDKTIGFNNEFIVFGLVFTACIFLFTGYITTNAGSLVRYRSIYYPFLIVPILCNIDWQKIKSFLKIPSSK